MVWETQPLSDQAGSLVGFNGVAPAPFAYSMSTPIQRPYPLQQAPHKLAAIMLAKSCVEKGQRPLWFSQTRIHTGSWLVTGAVAIAQQVTASFKYPSCIK